jgi:hypothetical protein
MKFIWALGAFVLAACGQGGLDAAAPATEATQEASAAMPDAVAPEDRSGPSRQARCRIGDGPMQPCRFTPLFGDGSFNIELPDGEYRMIVEGDRGDAFAVFGPEKRVPLLWSYRRDPADGACWVSESPDSEPSRICAY